MIVQLLDPAPEYPELSPKQPYVVIGIEADDYRLLNDRGQPYLYPHGLFAVLDPTEPAEWVTDEGEEGERYAYPAALNQPGFFEDYFEGRPPALQAFWHTINRSLTAA